MLQQTDNPTNESTISIMHDYLPMLALVFTMALNATLASLNRNQIIETREQYIINAIFCLAAGTIYVLYMMVSRILCLALACIEHKSYHYFTSPSSYYESVKYHQNNYDEDQEDEVDDLLITEDQPIVATAPYVSLLYAQGIHREALISSMYLGGSGCFLALPSLSFWDISTTCMLLLSLTIIGFTLETTKHSEFMPNQDKATVLKWLRRFRWLIYAMLVMVILGVLFKDNPHVLNYYLLSKKALNNTSASITMMQYTNNRMWSIALLLAFVSPMLLRLALPQAERVNRKLTPSLMSPSQVMEAALPVSCLHAVLVLSWYSSEVSIFDIGRNSLFKDKNLFTFIPMLVICPFCQAVILAFILRGFRKKQTLPTVIIMTITAFIVQQVFDYRLVSASDWFLFAILIKLVLLCLYFLYYQNCVILTKRKGKPPPVQEQSEDGF